MKKISSLALALLLALSLCLPALAAELDNVTDTVGVLSEEAWQELNDRADELAARYGCGVYAAIVDDYTEYGEGEISEVAGQIYETYDYGVGDERNGIFLFLSLNERDYSLYVSGEVAEYAFSSYARDKLAGEFTGALGEDDWAGGLSDYMTACGAYLDSAANGEPVQASPVGTIAMAIGIGCLVALIVCLILKRKMKSVHQGVSASEYVTAGGLTLTENYDRYTHTTETRRTIEKNTDNSSSGKF